MADDPQLGEQIPLLDVGEWWQDHWKAMPEFVQKDLMPFRTIYVHFECRAHMDQFSKLVEQPIGLNTKFIWYPEAELAESASKRYVDAAPPELGDSDIEVLDES